MPDFSKMSDQELEATLAKLKAGVPLEATPRPDYGASAYQTADGTVVQPKKGGGVDVIRQGPPQGLSADARSRVSPVMTNLIESQKRLYQLEGWASGKPHNPYNNWTPDRGGGGSPAVGAFIDAIPDNGMLSGVAKAVGGQTYQDYDQVAKTMEAAMLPIFSGAAVTPSEAARQLRANIPAPGDSHETLAQKALNRARMINTWARELGQPIPFPRAENRDARSRQGAAPGPRQNMPRTQGSGWKVVGVE